MKAETMGPQRDKEEVIGDVVKALKSQKEYDNKMLHDYITGKYPG